TDPFAGELGLDPGVFTLTRNGEPAETLTSLFTLGGTAVAGSDFQSLSGAVTFGIGESTAQVVVTPLADAEAEGTETVVLTLSSTAAYMAGNPGQATVQISDNPFDSWRFGRFTASERNDPTISGPGADPDRDGIPNALEWVLGSDPKVPGTSSLPRM